MESYRLVWKLCQFAICFRKIYQYVSMLQLNSVMAIPKIEINWNKKLNQIDLIGPNRLCALPLSKEISAG